MKANLSRKSFLLSLAACPFLMNPTPVFANGLSAGTDGSDGINVKSNGDETIITIVATGEWVSFYGMLKNSGDEIALLFSDGKTVYASRAGDCISYNGRPVISILTDTPASRACVEMTRKRYKIDTETRDLLAIVAGLVASGLPFPYGVLYTVVSTLLSFGTLNSTEYVETISYYCDTPTPRMRYTTNYYTDSRYTKIKYTMTGDSEFVNP